MAKVGLVLLAMVMGAGLCGCATFDDQGSYKKGEVQYDKGHYPEHNCGHSQSEVIYDILTGKGAKK